MPSDVTQIATCKGHKLPINCLEARSENIFASGSDDKTVRIWDARASPQRAQYCLCDCFSSPVDSLTFNPKDESMLYVSSGNDVVVFDLRSMDSMIQRIPLGRMKISDDSREGEPKGSLNEINTMKMHHKGQHLAVGDDEGNITVIEFGSIRNPDSWRVSKRLARGGHSSIIGAMAFRPSSIRELVSGGFDCVACSWDFVLGRLLARYCFNGSQSSPLTGQVFAGATAESAPAVPIINPPFVHALAYINSGRAVLTCCGDGTLRVINASSMTMTGSIEAHNGMATTLCVLPARGKRESIDIALSGGVDGYVKGWIVTSPTEESRSNSRTKSLEQAQIEPLFTIDHGCKINAVCSFSALRGSVSMQETDSEATVNPVIVADTTNVISLYSVL